MFPPFIRQLPLLDFADLSSNSITELPGEAVEGMKVVELNLNRNNLSVLPEALSKCSRLKVWDGRREGGKLEREREVS